MEPIPNASPVNAPNEDFDPELRPGGMCVQRRDYDDDSAAARGPNITIRVYHGSAHHVINLPAHSTFGELKGLVSEKTGVKPEEQKLLFRGKEKEDEEHLDTAGVRDNSRVMLLQEPKRKERSVGEMNESNEMLSDAAEAKAFEAIAEVRAEVDSLADRVSALGVAVNGGTEVSDKEFAVSTELLMRQLLKLDGIKAEGEARKQRKDEVRRVQNLVDTLDTLKAKNSNPMNNNSNGVTSQNSNGVTPQNSNGVTPQNSNGVTSQNGNAVSVTTKWETFDSGLGSLSAPTPMPSSTEVTEDWEKFD
ncbi:putative BAG domain-containing protein [Rosa chinensis]|uniref:Putative BAG domain-containing protein n=1 Tax=Rosa chinensis TaxID=74649 RepID=A0A2P6R8Y2_ROSCH|nr:BAG family molecular chaperone regulator 4 [Rosa chinensis]PRQ42874.1 putative BAG domain-containing protein [Rosa chinensis]